MLHAHVVINLLSDQQKRKSRWKFAVPAILFIPETIRLLTQLAALKNSNQSKQKPRLQRKINKKASRQDTQV